MKWIAFITGALLIIIFTYFTVTAFAHYDEVQNECETTCPVVHFEWTTKSCPNGYHDFSQEWCEKNGAQFDLKPYNTQNHSVDVAYEKSQDGNHCHRPSDNTLEDEYGMDHDTRQAFKDENPELLDSIQSYCPTPTEEVTPTTQPTPTEEITPTPEDECEECCEKDCEEVTPTPTPTETPKDEPKGDSNGDPKESHPLAPAAVTCNIPFEPADVWYTKENGSATFRWSTSVQDIDKFSIIYGRTENNLEWGVDNIPSDSRGLDINGLDGTTWFSVITWRDGCAVASKTIDP